MKKQIYISALHYEMLLDVSRKSRPNKKPEQIIEDQIKNLYMQIK
tara:strand:+ start:377 stop:511 length:135 start_codon:yes stop_codon:yes gene_type:complete